MRNDFYNQASIAVVMDGSPDVDHHNGDAVRLIPDGGGAIITNGYDSSTLSFSSIKSGKFEQDFSQTSPSLDKYETLYRLQQSGRGRKFDGMFITATGKQYLLKGCAVENPGQVSAGAAEGGAQTVVLVVSEVVPL